MQDTEILSALFETTRTLGISGDLDTLLSLILERARDLTGFDHCALMLVDPDTGDLVVRSVLGYEETLADVSELRLPGGQGLTGWAVQHRTPVRIGDVEADDRYVPGLSGARSNLAVPLILENEVAGVLNVESRQRDAFDERHEKVLTVLGTQAALAIFASQARSSLQSRIAQLDALYHISGLTWADKTLEELAEAVVEETARVVPSASSALLLMDADGDGLTLVAHVGYDEGVTGLELPLDRGIVGRCARTGEIQVVADVREDPDYYPGVEGARCEVALPLQVQGNTIGVLDVESDRIQSIADDQVRTLGMIAQQIAAVLETARVQEERLKLVNTDPLTGLANRRHFEERLARGWRRVQRDGGQLSLVLLDLDRFKLVNDVHGHDVGDIVLTEVAACLQQIVRQDDTLARIGGEEFAVIAPGVGPGAARRMGDRLRGAVEEMRVQPEDGPSLRMTLSVGVATLDARDSDPATLVKRADEALYKAKSQGRNRVVGY